MSFSYGFFNAQNLDRVYTAEDFTAYLSSLICNGILDTYRQCFAPTVKNLSVTFGTGKAWNDHSRSRLLHNDSEIHLHMKKGRWYAGYH